GRRRQQRRAQHPPGDFPSGEQQREAEAGEHETLQPGGHAALTCQCSTWRSSVLIADCATNPSTQISSTIASTVALSKFCVARFMIAPRFTAAKNSSAVIMPLMARADPTRNAAKKNGSNAGSTINRSRWPCEAPNERPT